MALHPEHLSPCYGLKLEPARPFFEYANSPPAAPSDDEQADHVPLHGETLERYGYVQYEISNFALPGRESRHNLKYWLRGDYLGLGCAAHSCIGDLRYSNTRDVHKYISGILGDKSIIDEYEHLSSLEKAGEYIMLGLRTTRGITRREYLSIYKSSFDPLESLLDTFVKSGWARRNGENWSFTSTGFLLSERPHPGCFWRRRRSRKLTQTLVRYAFEALGQTGAPAERRRIVQPMAIAQ
jgi:oxygen-independent coproporphyrinogen-3 oxidase